MAPGDTTEILLSRINEAKINFDDGNWKHVSNEAKVKKNYFKLFLSLQLSLINCYLCQGFSQENAQHGPETAHHRREHKKAPMDEQHRLLARREIESTRSGQCEGRAGGRVQALQSGEVLRSHAQSLAGGQLEFGQASRQQVNSTWRF